MLWVVDITYAPTWAGFLYLAVVLDAFPRRIVGWTMETNVRMQLILDAMNMALGQRRRSKWSFQLRLVWSDPVAAARGDWPKDTGRSWLKDRRGPALTSILRTGSISGHSADWPGKAALRA
ncbi:hypothetical protein DEA8626_03012 [Defluviimonas aquaemixtae]|uniref:Integrase catalytic domain-containing protein n=1 Tax=Albidovulum aquaemixtae TaxID=1542388 RepID=A0A2R8BKN6_9RHOB|nr:hypothetical protein DEA8626_03012 [Defluviimonas aquaemixtae]